MKVQIGVEFLAFTFTLSFGTIVTADISAVRACSTLHTGKLFSNISVRGWMQPTDNEIGREFADSKIFPRSLNVPRHLTPL